MKIIECQLGIYEIIKNGTIIGKINRTGNYYTISKNGEFVGKIIPKEFIQNYCAYDGNGNEIGKGVFEVLLSLFFN